MLAKEEIKEHLWHNSIFAVFKNRPNVITLFRNAYIAGKTIKKRKFYYYLWERGKGL